MESDPIDFLYAKGVAIATFVRLVISPILTTRFAAIPDTARYQNSY